MSVFSLFIVYLFAPRAMSSMPCNAISCNVLPMLRIFCPPKHHTCNCCVSWLHLRVPTATVIATIYNDDLQPPQMMLMFIYSSCCGNLRVCPAAHVPLCFALLFFYFVQLLLQLLLFSIYSLLLRFHYVVEDDFVLWLVSCHKCNYENVNKTSNCRVTTCATSSSLSAYAISFKQPDVLSVAAASVAATKTNNKSSSISRRPPAVAPLLDCLADCYHLFLVHSHCVFSLLSLLLPTSIILYCVYLVF